MAGRQGWEAEKGKAAGEWEAERGRGRINHVISGPSRAGGREDGRRREGGDREPRTENRDIIRY